MEAGAIMFPQSGRKSIPSEAELLKQASVSLPVVFSNYDAPENGRWQGEQLKALHQSHPCLPEP